MGAAVSVRNLHHAYGGPQPALRRLDLDVPQGSIFALVGPNGAGKTTLLRILSTLLEATYGEARIDGIDVRRSPLEVRRRIGFMADDFALYEDMKVLDYLVFFAGCYGVPDDGRCDRLLERVRLGEKREEVVKGLSRGMRQRLCLAKTLVHEPSVLLLDEPASGLDPQARIEFRDLLKSLGREGKTILISSHILTELSDFCDSMAVLEKGRCVVSGRIEDILAETRPERRFRLRVLGEPEGALALLPTLAGVKGVALAEGAVLFELDGDDERLASVHLGLVSGGVKVLELSLERRSLESIFLRVSSGDVA